MKELMIDLVNRGIKDFHFYGDSAMALETMCDEIDIEINGDADEVVMTSTYIDYEDVSDILCVTKSVNIVLYDDQLELEKILDLWKNIEY